MVLQINEKQEANRVYLTQGISELEYVSKYNYNNDLIIYPTQDIPSVSFLKYVDGIIIEDIERVKEFEFNVFSQECLELLRKTDYLCLSDNPANFSDEQLSILFSFRKELRNYKNTKTFPETPDFINSKI